MCGMTGEDLRGRNRHKTGYCSNGVYLYITRSFAINT
jgi:hypothetical protein